MMKSWNAENVETAQRDVSIVLYFLSHNSPSVPYIGVYTYHLYLLITNRRFYGERASGRLKKRILPCSPKHTKIAVTSSWYIRSTTAEHFRVM